MTEILAIDDDREILAVIKKALLREGYQVTALEDPLQLEEDKLGRYQLILLDVMMPGMTGLICAAESVKKWIVRFCFSRQKPKRKM